MPILEMHLGKDELELLGTDNQEEAEKTLAMLAEVALLEILPECMADADQPVTGHIGMVRTTHGSDGVPPHG